MLQGTLNIIWREEKRNYFTFSSFSRLLFIQKRTDVYYAEASKLQALGVVHMHVICISDIHFIYTKLTHEANELSNYILKLIFWTNI